MVNNSKLKQLVNCYWLRPESAVFRYLDFINSKKFKFKSPSLDMGCGDGVLSFIRNGGEFTDDFSVFINSGNTKDFFKNIDVFNTHKENIKKFIKKKPKIKIDYGLDHKINLLKKSKQLNLYNNLIHADANEIIPFEDGKFNSIFSNVLYWLKDPINSIKEITRILKKGGKLCIFIPSENIIKNSFYFKYYKLNKNNKYKFLRFIDRGKFSNNQMRSLTKIKIYEKNFKKLKLKIITKKKYMSDRYVKIWDIGFRPFFPVFNEILKNLKAQKKKYFKNLWIKNLNRFILPIIFLEKKEKKSFNFYCYILEKTD